MPRTVKDIENYSRLLDGSGNAITSTAGAIDVTFSADVTSATHDNFNVNANLQVGDVDLAFGSATSANSLPVVIASDQGAVSVSDSTAQSSLSAIDTKLTAVGTHANASNAQTTAGADQPSTNSIDCQNTSVISAFGSVDQATTITLQQSQDDSNWYDTGHSFVATGPEDFHMVVSSGARYFRVVYSASGTTATCTIAGKK